MIRIRADKRSLPSYICAPRFGSLNPLPGW